MDNLNGLDKQKLVLKRFVAVHVTGARPQKRISINST